MICLVVRIGIILLLERMREKVIFLREHHNLKALAKVLSEVASVRVVI